LEHKPLLINGDGEQKRDFIHVKDVAEANLKAMESRINYGFFNIGTGKSTSINKLAELLIELSKTKLKIIYGPPMQGDIVMSQADTTLAEKRINWKYKVELEEGLEKFFPKF